MSCFQFNIYNSVWFRCFAIRSWMTANASSIFYSFFILQPNNNENPKSINKFNSTKLLFENLLSAIKYVAHSLPSVLKWIKFSCLSSCFPKSKPQTIRTNYTLKFLFVFFILFCYVRTCSVREFNSNRIWRWKRKPAKAPATSTSVLCIMHTEPSMNLSYFIKRRNEDGFFYFSNRIHCL